MANHNLEKAVHEQHAVLLDGLHVQQHWGGFFSHEEALQRRLDHALEEHVGGAECAARVGVRGVVGANRGDNASS